MEGKTNGMSIAVKKVLSIFIILSVLTGCMVDNAIADVFSVRESAESSFQLRNGIHFGDYIDNVKDKESQDIHTKLRIDSREEYTHYIGDPKEFFDNEYLKYDGSVAGYSDAHVTYYFDLSTNNLIEMSYAFFSRNSPVDTSAFVSTLREKYGNPRIDDELFPVPSLDIYQVLNSFNRFEGDIDNYSEWIVQDNNNAAVKIELLSYYYSEHGAYWCHINYHYISPEEMETINQNNIDKQDALKNDL